MPSPEPCRHVGKVLLRGLLEGQIPVPVVADRGSLMVSTVLGKVNSEALHQALELVVEKGTLLVSDGNCSYPMYAEALLVYDAQGRLVGKYDSDAEVRSENRPIVKFKIPVN